MLKKYIDLTKPERTLANVITTLAGFLLGSKLHINFGLLLATLTGLTLIVASACVLNNYIDRDLDTKMARTKKRALATGEVSAIAGLLYSIVLGVIGFAMIALWVNWLVIILAAIAYFDYIVLYGIGKRKTIFGTLIGTVCGALPLVAGYCAVVGKLDVTAVLLFLSMVCWQMAHFYSIAIYRLKDYKAAGMPVWPAIRGIRETKIHIIIYIIAFLIASASLSFFGPTGFIYLFIMVIINIDWLRKGLNGWNAENDTKWARGMFVFSLKVLLVFAATISLSAVLP